MKSEMKNFYTNKSRIPHQNQENNIITWIKLDLMSGS